VQEVLDQQVVQVVLEHQVHQDVMVVHLYTLKEQHLQHGL
jgi:hypothetical protein